MPKVAAADVDVLTVDGRAADRPLRDAAVDASVVVVVVSVADVRDAFEACRQPASDLLLTDEAGSRRFSTVPRMRRATGFARRSRRPSGAVTVVC
jgi:hypothetical protein